MVLYLSLAVVVAVIVFVVLIGRPNPQLKADQMKVGGSVFSVEIASSTLAQARGLSFRDSLGDGKGMLFVFGGGGVRNFWMKDMKFPIDMIWIAGNAVAGFAENAAPQPGVPVWGLKIYSSPDGVDKVLEVDAGTVAKRGIKVGDAVVLGGTE